MDVLQFYQDYNIPYQTEGHRHCRPGWVNTECPLCTGNPGLHLGYPITGGVFRCWRCGVHNEIEVIMELLHVSKNEAYIIFKKYKGNSNDQYITEPIIYINKKPHKLPSGVNHLLKSHKQYLIGRNYDPDKIEREWNLMSTGPISLLDNINFSHRIIAPIIWDQKQVSFQGRDVTNKHPLKYITCPKPRELIFHKDILYGNQQYWTNTIIVVEGITDVWRFGVHSCATFGIEYSRKQVLLLSKFKHVAVAYDFEPQAQIKARALISSLRLWGCDAFLVDIKDDPGNMTQTEADYLVKQIINH